MATGRLSISGSVAGAPFNDTITRTADGAINHEVSLPAAKTGTLSTRTTDTTGTLTMEAAHGIETADLIDVYWDVGGVKGMRHDVVVGEVAVNDVPISGGSGDNLPAEDSAVTAQVQQVVDTDFVGSKVVMAGCACAHRSHVGFVDTGTTDPEVELTAGEPWFWADGGPTSNPFTGVTVDEARVTQASTSAVKLYIGIVYDSTV